MPTGVSEHIEHVMQSQNGIATVQVVFTDIEKYSMRRSALQRAIIERYSGSVKLLLSALGKSTGIWRNNETYIRFAENNGIDFFRDVIKIPTGDGIAVVSCFEGLPRLHLRLAAGLLLHIERQNQADNCRIFKAKAWCDCHASFRVRIGISEGRAVLYKDVNGNNNAAGHAVNLAARVMGVADGMQIMMSNTSHTSLIDLTPGNAFRSSFRVLRSVLLKHGIQEDVYQYCPSDMSFVDTSRPSLITSADEQLQFIKRLSAENAELKSLIESVDADAADDDADSARAASLQRLKTLAARARAKTETHRYICSKCQRHFQDIPPALAALTGKAITCRSCHIPIDDDATLTELPRA